MASKHGEEKTSRSGALHIQPTDRLPHLEKLSLVYCTNVWNHYQAPICAEFVRLLGADRFKLCLFETVDEERRKLGWTRESPIRSWIVGPPINNNDLIMLCQVVCEADVAVLGHCPQSIRSSRAATGKLTFVMSERLWKQPHHWWRMINPRYARGVSEYKRVANNENMHYLAIGYYAADDVRKIGAFADRIWTWAYFADVAHQPPLPRNDARIQILWVGRMLKWKRVDLLLKAVSVVRGEPNFGHLHLVGSGAEKTQLTALAQRLKLSGDCTFHEPLSADGIRNLMREVDIYVLPSNRYEGWGVVANEAMSEGAVLVANEQAGATRMLVDDGRTGFIFRDDDDVGLASILKSLMSDSTLREKTRRAAWEEVQRVWHPRIGAERFVGLCRWKLGLSPMPVHETGPCSRC